MTLEQLLNQQIALLLELDELLTTEQSTLLSFPVNGEALTRIADGKHKAFTRLEKLDTLRRDAQKARGYSNDNTGSAQAAADNNCGSLWRHFIDLAQQVDQKNSINGGLIDRQLLHNQKALNILGELSGRPAYGADGRAQQRTTNLNLSV